MFPILNLGPLAIQVPGLFLIAGIWVALNLVEREAVERRLSSGEISNLVLVGLIAGIIGARVWYALRFLNVYMENPVSLFSLNPSTLASQEGILTGVLAAIVYARRKLMPLWPTLDALTPGLAALGIALGLSHLASGDAFGAPSRLPWAIDLWGELRHPSQIYEIMAAILILWLVWRMKRWDTFNGFLFLSWLGLVALSRLILEITRGDSVIVFGSLRSAQVVSLGVLLLAMMGLHVLGRKQKENL
jgi:phosphatidylglycerol:prolipoprotein diacylglycerol transferase